MGQERPETKRKTAMPNHGSDPHPNRQTAPEAELADWDIVDEASEDSFPASDPPNWATGQQREPA
jgi:hypothetical protein